MPRQTRSTRRKRETTADATIPAVPSQPTTEAPQHGVQATGEEIRVMLLQNYLRQRDEAKVLYQQADVTLKALMPLMRVGETITLPDGKKFTLEDKFAVKNVVFHATACRRFDIKQVKQPRV